MKVGRRTVPGIMPQTAQTVHPEFGTTATGRRGLALPWLARGIMQVYPRALGALFLLTAMQKSLDSSGVERVMEFNGLPQALISPLVSAVIVIEAFLGVVLLLRPMLRPVLLSAAALVGVYTLQLAYLASSAEAPGCACLAAWESYQSARTQNLLGVARNVCLTLPLLWIVSQLKRPAPARTPPTHTSGTASASP